MPPCDRPSSISATRGFGWLVSAVFFALAAGGVGAMASFTWYGAQLEPCIRPLGGVIAMVCTPVLPLVIAAAFVGGVALGCCAIGIRRWRRAD